MTPILDLAYCSSARNRENVVAKSPPSQGIAAKGGLSLFSGFGWGRAWTASACVFQHRIVER